VLNLDKRGWAYLMRSKASMSPGNSSLVSTSLEGGEEGIEGDDDKCLNIVSKWEVVGGRKEAGKSNKYIRAV
jgi:hypothetical protein